MRHWVGAPSQAGLQQTLLFLGSRRPVERKAPQGSSDWMSKLTAQLESHSANRRPGPSASGGFE